MALAIGTETAVSRNNSILARQVTACAGCPLRSRSLCAGIPDAALDSLARATTRLHVDAGDIIFDEGEPADHVVKLTSGTAEIFKMLPDGRRQVIGFLFAGDIAGLAVQDAYIYSANAITEVTLCRFPRRQVRSMLERFPQAEHHLLRMTVSELTSAQNQMVLLGRKTACEKIASFLLMLRDRAGNAESGEVPIPMTRADIADYLGLTTETVSRTFTELRKRGYIKPLDASTIQLSDRNELNCLAGG